MTIPSSAHAVSTIDTSKGTAGTSNTTDPLANKETFLQLLVAQIKNQDPMSPSDSTQFVTQLAQFSQLEQSVSMRQDLDSINSTLTSSTANTGSGTTSGAANNTN